MMFYLTNEAGEVTGPHTAGVLRRKLEAGEMSLDALTCVQGTEDWVPVHVYEQEICGLAARRPQQDHGVRQMQMMLAMQEEKKGKAADMAWRNACVCFGLGLLSAVLPVALAFFLLGLCGLAELLCAVVLFNHARLGKGFAALLFALLLTPVLVVRM